MNIQKVSSESSEPVLCVNCHSFYGSKSTKGLCSSCFKKGSVDQKEVAAKQETESKTETVALTEEEPVKEEKPQEIQKDRKRCFECQKKVGMLGTECKCKFVFCNSHRLPETHTCSYNFKKAGQVELEKAVIKVTNGKIAHI